MAALALPINKILTSRVKCERIKNNVQGATGGPRL